MKFSQFVIQFVCFLFWLKYILQNYRVHLYEMFVDSETTINKHVISFKLTIYWWFPIISLFNCVN